MIPLGERFGQALIYAFELHKRQERKGNLTPYIAHPLGVCALVLEDGGDEDEAIAALLHDAAEDQGGLKTLEEIRRRFGEQVAAIVDGCTDTYETPKPAWRGRKEAYLEHLRSAEPAVVRVSLADKLHNARAILTDLYCHGDQLWERFNGGKAGSLWYYRSLADIFKEIYRDQKEKAPMATLLDETVSEIERISA